MLFTWLQDDYKQLAASFIAGNFHALLVSGAARSGQQTLIDQLIQFMLCQSPQNNEPCGKCSACVLYHEHNHPDLFTLTADNSEERKTLQIKVDQIRDVIEFAHRSLHLAVKKIIYIPRLAELNISSSNALLKILEEPPSNCIFVLQADDIARVLPTIKSRCFKYQLHKPTHEQALAELKDVPNAKFWLKYFDGEPLFDVPFGHEQLDVLLATLQKPSIENIFALTKELDPKKIGIDIILEFIFKWLSDLIQVNQGSNANYFSTYGESLHSLAKRLDKDKFYNLQSDIVFLLGWSSHPLNHKLQLENLLFKYQQLYV